MKSSEFKFVFNKNQLFAITNSWPPIVSGHGRFFFQLLKNFENKLVITPLNSHLENSNEILPLLRYASIHNSTIFKSLLQHFEILTKPLLLIFKSRVKPRLTIASQVLFSGLTSYLIKLFFKIPYIIVAHGEEFSIYQNNKVRLKYYLAKLVAQNSSMIICNTHNTSYLIERFYNIDKSKMSVIHPVVDINESNFDLESISHWKYQKFRNKKVILMTGRLNEERKGFDVGIEAFLNVKRIYPDVCLIIIGPGSNSRLIDLVAKNNLSDAVQFLGKVDRSTLLKFYSICDIFLMPNRTLSNGDMEGFGMVFLEANMFGKPVIAGRSGGVLDAVEDMVSGLLVNGENVEEVTESILKLLLDDKFRNMLGVSARQRVLTKFNEEVQSRKFQSIINELIK